MAYYIGVLVIIIGANRIKRKKLELNDEDLVLFYRYKELMNGKLISKRPEGLTEWEKHIWILAFQDNDQDNSRKMWTGILIFFVALLVFILILAASGN